MSLFYSINEPDIYFEPHLDGLPSIWLHTLDTPLVESVITNNTIGS